MVFHEEGAPIIESISCFFILLLLLLLLQKPAVVDLGFKVGVGAS